MRGITRRLVPAVGGNIGIPVLFLPELGPEGLYVLELSSYQLELSRNLDINVVGWLNISPDHLERHGNTDSYVAAKYKIFQQIKHTIQAVIGIDDPYSCDIFQKHSQDKKHATIPVSCIQALENGIYIKEQHLFRAQKGNGIPLADLSKIPRLQGIHNYQNIGVAYGIAEILGLTALEIIEAIKTFPGLEHRQELVGEMQGVTFINDSKATNADAASKALSVYDNIYWIAGGVAKSEGIDSLSPYFHKIKEAFLIGQAQEEFFKVLDGKVTAHMCEILENALIKAFQAAKRDGYANPVVLFSPACASFDQFKDFEDRGSTFKKLVKEHRGINA